MRRKGMLVALLMIVAGLGMVAYPYFKQKQAEGRAPVQGTVTGADGEPLVGALVRFHASELRNGAVETVSCVSQAEGRFACQAFPGAYRVTLLAAPPLGQRPKDAPPQPRVPPGVPTRYTSTKDTPWEVHVPRGGKVDVELRVEK